MTGEQDLSLALQKNRNMWRSIVRFVGIAAVLTVMWFAWDSFHPIVAPMSSVVKDQKAAEPALWAFVFAGLLLTVGLIAGVVGIATILKED